jgi:hypothetical protein
MQEMKLQGAFTEVNPELDNSQEGLMTQPLDPLALDIPDEDLCDNIDDRISQSRDFYAEEYDLYDRREKNAVYYFGRQILQKEKEKLLKNYESKYMDNVLYEIEATIKPLAMSRLPDLMVLPGNDNEEAVLTAQEVSKVIDTQIKERDNRKVLGLAFKHLPVYFTGVIKVRWDPEIDDYRFECIHPDLIDVDHTSPTNNADDMQFVSQLVPLTVEQIVMRFPNKKDEFFAQLKKDGLMVGENPSWRLMATTIKIREVWFTWYKKHENTEWERIEGVLWKYKDVILKKMKNPNFDYEGETRYFAYDTPNDASTKRSLNEQELMQILATGQLPGNVKQEQVYHNFFKHPRKPFYFLGYDQWGKQPFDETSRIEQNLQNQKSLDKRGKQLEETLDERGHNVFSKEAGLTPADVEELDMNDPDEDLVVDGDVNATHKFIPPERPDAAEFKEMDNIRARMYAISGSNAVRGNIQSDVATTNQIAREADFTRADDLVEDTINDAAEWMAGYAMQMIKLRYTKDHFVDVLGIAGESVWIKLNRNMIMEGMVVKMKASGTDKLRAQNNALEMAKMQMIDPYTFFTDMKLSDPEGRTEKLILSKTDPMAYLQKVVKGLNTSEALAQALMNAELPNQGQPATPPPTAPMAEPAQQAQQAPQQPMQPQNPAMGNTANVPAQPPVGAPTGSPRGL